MKIENVNFKRFFINPSSSRSSLVANVQLGSGEEKFLQLDKNLTFNEASDGKYEAKVNTVKSMMASTLVIYDKSTMFFEKDAEVRKELENGLKNTSTIAVLKSGNSAYVGIPPLDIEMDMSGIVQDRNSGSDISQSKKNEKENLKSYETPSDVYDILLSSQQTMFFDAVANRIARGYAKNIWKDYAKNNKNTTYSEDIFGMELSNILIEAISGKDIQNSVNDSKHTKVIRKIFSEIEEEQKNSKTFILKMNKISNSMFPMKLFYEDEELRDLVKKIAGFDDKKVKFPVLDLQAGSGEGLLKGFDNAGYDENILFGTEIRNNIEQHDSRYKVKKGINSVTYASAIESTFENKTISLAATNLQIYLNPPYTSEDYVTKKTFESLDTNAMVYGLFPTKNQKFLSHQIDGVIVDIPREITGYTDPKTPERFLMVFGALHQGEMLTSSLLGGSVKTLPTNKQIVFDIKENESIDDAKKRLSFLITNTTSTMVSLKARFKEQYDYYVNGSENRMTIVQNKLEEKIDLFDKFLSSLGLRQEALDIAKESIFKQFTPVDIAKTQKVFPDTRYYSSDGKANNYYFREVISNISLLNDYQKKSPSLFNIVKEVADSMNVQIPISIEKQDVFKLTERNIPETKTLVTNMELGLMKSKYYPVLIDLSQEEDKQELANIFLHVAGKRESGRKLHEGVETLEKILQHAQKMVLKNEQILIPSEGIMQNREVYVLQDPYEKDIGKLNLSLTDFYDELQERGLFDIRDYVEEVKPQNSLKKDLVLNFLEYTENIARTIEQETDLKKLTIIVDAFKTRNAIEKKYKEFTRSVAGVSTDSSEYLALKDNYNMEYRSALLGFIEKHKLSTYLEDKIVFPNMNKLLNQIVKGEAFNHLRNKDKNEIKTIIDNRFSGREVLFFEDRVNEYNHLKSAFERFGIEGEDFEKTLYDIYDAITPMYVAKKTASNAYVKLGAMFVVDYTKMKQSILQKKDPVDVFDRDFETMFLRTFELRPHQYKESINTVALDKKLSMLLWEMRVGKSLTFAASLFLTGLAKKEDMSLFVETANLQDISSQIFEYMPQMFFQMRAFHTEPKKIDLNENIVYERLLTDKFYPNIVSVLNRRDSDLVAGGGTTLNSLKTDYNAKMENLLEKLEERAAMNESGEIDLSKLKSEYQDSPLIKLLELCEN